MNTNGGTCGGPEMDAWLARQAQPAADQAGKPARDRTFPTCAAVGHCPRPTADAAPYHHFYWDGERDEKRMERIHGKNGKGHEDPMSEFGAVICKTCGLQALVNMDAEDFPQI